MIFFQAMKSLEDLEEELETAPPGFEELASENPKRRRDTLDRIIAGQHRAALGAVLRRIKSEDNPYVLSRALSAAGALGAPRAVKAVASCLENVDLRVQANALEALKNLSDREHIPQATALLESPEPRLAANAIVYLAQAGVDFDARAALERMVASRDPRRQASGLWAAGQVSPERLVDLLALAAGSPDPEVIERVKAMATAIGGEKAKELLEDLEAGEVVAGEALEIRPAPLFKRTWAWLADSVLLAAVALVAIGVAVAGAADYRRLLFHWQLILLGYSIAFFVRDGLGGGRGLGKRYMGLRVVDLATRTGCGYLKSMIRQSTFYLPLINVAEVVWASVDPDHRRIVDHLLGTMVIDERDRPLSTLDRGLFGILVTAFVAGIIGMFILALTPAQGLTP